VAKRNPFAAIAHGHDLAEAIVDAIREPLLVLDPDLRVIAASRSFYRTFAVTPRKTQGQLIFDLGDGQWNIPKLRALLEVKKPIRTEYLIVDKGKLAGAGAHSYTKGDATKGSEEAAKYKNTVKS